jgi:VIT1/CCC1 family predicted Fe2+/Mn2+ transporter
VGIYRQRGLDREDAERIAAVLMRDPQTALDVHAREELGIDPQLTGSPVAAAASSFGSFSVGAIIPLIPWFITSGTAAAVASIVLGALTALAIGWTVAVFTRRSRLHSAARQLVITAVAAAVTFAVGSLVGVRTT